MVKVFLSLIRSYTPFPGNGHNRAWVGNKIIYGSPRNNGGNNNGGRTRERSHNHSERGCKSRYVMACIHDWASK